MIIRVEKSVRQNSAYRHHNMKGAFGNEGAFLFFLGIGSHECDNLPNWCLLNCREKKTAPACRSRRHSCL